ncbi:MAG: TetR/AcrR family transcriptional regulator [Candidatus Nanopelagicales bacterium]
MSTAQVRRRGPGSRAGGDHPTRRELMDAAADIVDAEGLSGLSVETVTREAGHAKGTFYVHFSDRTELLVELHRRFHDELFGRIRSTTHDMPRGPERARSRIIAFLDGCRQQPGVRSMLLQARALPEIADLVRERNDQAALELAADLAGVTPSPRDTARLLVAATAEAALQELEARRRLPRLRAALLAMVPS